MLNAKQAQAMVVEYKQAKLAAAELVAEEWLNETVAPRIEDTANSGMTELNIKHTLNYVQQDFALKKLQALGYKTSAGCGVIDIRW